MSLLDPNTVTALDVVTDAMGECGAFGPGQTPMAADVTRALVRLTGILQQWAIKRWLVYSSKTLGAQTTGLNGYTVGPGGQFDFGGQSRPQQLDAVYFSQPGQGGGLPVDYPITLMPSRADYDLTTLKSLVTFPRWGYYQPDYPLGQLLLSPIPLANIYTLYITVRNPIAQTFQADGSTQLVLPPEYYRALVLVLAVHLRNMYKLNVPNGDSLGRLAAEHVEALRNSNLQLSTLSMPKELGMGRGGYNIFSDTRG